METSAPQLREKPLSPHLTVYKWHVSMAMSITHRATGIALVFGAVLLGWLLIAAALGQDIYQHTTRILDTLPGQVFLFGWTLSLYYHLINGIRHLLWDIGWGFKVKDVTGKGIVRNGLVIGSLTLLLTAATWYVWAIR
jgi:succinate dehydrogenase / fumarate reductase cytochrome b subunit